MADFLIEEFYKAMKGVKLEAYGVLDSNCKIHTLGTDSKIIGRIFEMYIQPILIEITEKHNLMLKTPESQTLYPDFILMENEKSSDKIAIDIKTTYIKSEGSLIKFTLGSYGSYMRNNTKNIEYRYTDYSKHYVIGFVYKRNDRAQQSSVYNYEDRNKISFPYSDVKFFVQEKYKIAGDKTGSGNTENIGSFVSKNFDDFKYGRGPFSQLGEDIYNLYWKYYPKYRTQEKTYTSLEEFIEWLPKQKKKPELLYQYDFDAVLTRIQEYKQHRGMYSSVYDNYENRQKILEVADYEIEYGKD